MLLRSSELLKEKLEVYGIAARYYQDRSKGSNAKNLKKLMQFTESN